MCVLCIWFDVTRSTANYCVWFLFCFAKVWTIKYIVCGFAAWMHSKIESNWENQQKKKDQTKNKWRCENMEGKRKVQVGQEQWSCVEPCAKACRTEPSGCEKILWECLNCVLFFRLSLRICECGYVGVSECLFCSFMLKML